jgi:hypothetical protein
MIPYLLGLAGGYLIGNATKDKQLFADMTGKTKYSGGGTIPKKDNRYYNENIDNKIKYIVFQITTDEDGWENEDETKWGNLKVDYLYTYAFNQNGEATPNTIEDAYNFDLQIHNTVKLLNLYKNDELIRSIALTGTKNYVKVKQLEKLLKSAFGEQVVGDIVDEIIEHDRLAIFGGPPATFYYVFEYDKMP